MPETKKNFTFENTFMNKIFGSRKTINAPRDWSILLGIFSVLIIGSLFFDAYTYNNISSGEMYITVKRSELHLETVNVKNLTTLLNFFEVKRQNYSQLKVDNLSDPSL